MFKSLSLPGCLCPGFCKSLRFFLFFLLLILYPVSGSATAILIDENGNSFAYTYNKEAGKTRSLLHKPAYGIPSGNAYIQKGTLLPVYVPETIRHETYQPWETIIFKLAEDLTVNGVTIAPAGTSVFGKVTESIQPEMLDTVGRIRIKMDSLYTYRNVRIPLNRIIERKDDMLERRWAEFGSFELFGANVRIPKYEIFLVEVDDDTDLGITPEQLKKFGVYFGISPEKRMYEDTLTQLKNRPY